MTTTMAALLASTAKLVDIPSVSRNEAAIADHVEAVLRGFPHLEITRIANNVVAKTNLGRATRVILAGHLDTVPPAGNERAVVSGSRLTGLGSADMKGGLAVMLALAGELTEPLVDCTYIFYVCEEIARSASGLRVIEAVRPDLLAAHTAVVLEPTNAIIEAGCQGVVRFTVTMRGKRAHSARPWVGTNAIHRLGLVLARIAAFPERQPVIDGVTYHETLQAVGIEGGVAGNVIPDVATVVVSHRFAPDRDAKAATEALQAYFDDLIDTAIGDDLQIVDTAPGAAPNLEHPILMALAEASGATPVAKTAWTDVAFFAERDVPAANFGPGDPLVAHSAGEFVEADEIARVADALRTLLG